MDKTTVETYNELAKEYDEETAGFWEKFPRAIIDKFAESVKSGKVIDVGSGPGRDGLLLMERGFDVVCLDASREMVKIASSKGLKTVLGDFSELPFPDGSFRGAWAYTSLLHVPKPEVEIPLKEIRRVLEPGGILGLGMMEGNTQEYRFSSGIDKPRLFSFYEKEEIEALLGKNGFEVVYFEQFMPKTKNYLNFISRKT